MNPSTDAASPSPVALSGDEAEVLTARIAELGQAQLPLSGGLRAAAADARGKLARAMRRVADDLDRGAPLSEALAPSRVRLPEHVRGLMLASAAGPGGAANRSEAEEAAAVLGELLEQRRLSRELRRKVWASLVYPLAVFAIVLLIFIPFQYFGIAPFAEMLAEFELELPQSVKVSLWWSKRGIWALAAVAVAAPVLLVVARLVLGPVRWRRLIATAPLFGPLWHWSAVAEMSRLLAVMLERRMPLGEALGLAAGGVSDANVRKACQEMATAAESGRALSDLIADSARLPPALVPLVAWGERCGELPAALRSASELYAQRVENRSVLLRTILPPFAMLAIGALALALLNTVVAPMLSLIQGLT